MPTQLIEFEAPSGMTLTAKLYTSGSDTVAYTASVVTEQTNRKGVYRATFANVAANTYQLVATVGTSAVAVWWGYAQNSNATYQFGSSVAGVWDELMTNHTISGSYGSHVVRSANQNQNTVQITGSQHIAADIHELQPAVITAADFATNAIDSNALSADAVAEIAAGVSIGGTVSANVVQWNGQSVSVSLEDLFIVRVNAPVNKVLNLTSGGSYKKTGSKDSRVYFKSDLFPLMTGLTASNVKLYIKDLKTGTVVCNGLVSNEINTTTKEVWFSYGTDTTLVTTSLVANNPCKYQIVFEYAAGDKEIVARGVCTVAPILGS